MKTASKPIVGFVGTGRMGGSMAKNILKKGFDLIVWNRDPRKLTSLIDLGAKTAPTPKRLAEESGIIVTMLATPIVTESIIAGTGDVQGIGVIDGIREGKIVVDMSTNLPSMSRKLSRIVEEKKGKFLDSPVLGSLRPAAEGTLVILSSGDKDAFERTRPVLETMGNRIWYTGDTGTACTMKLTMNLHLNLITAAFAESLVFGVKSGLDPNLIVEIWNNSFFKTYITENKGERALKGDWTPTFTVELALKDMALVSEVSKEVNAPIPLGSIVRELYNAAVAQGKKDLDFSAIVNVYENLANVRVSNK